MFGLCRPLSTLRPHPHPFARPFAHLPLCLPACHPAGQPDSQPAIQPPCLDGGLAGPSASSLARPFIRYLPIALLPPGEVAFSCSAFLLRSNLTEKVLGIYGSLPTLAMPHAVDSTRTAVPNWECSLGPSVDGSMIGALHAVFFRCSAPLPNEALIFLRCFP